MSVMIVRQDKRFCGDGFVLIGGASSRFGRDKSQIVLGGKKLFERASDVLRQVCSGRISLVGGRTPDVVVLPDQHIPGQPFIRAPLVGLYTALVNADTRWIAVLACDLPLVTAHLMTRLADICSAEFDAVVPKQPNSRPQPLCAFYRREVCLPAVEEALKTGDLKLQRFLARLATRYVEFEEIAALDGSSELFLNINTRSDFDLALQVVEA